jgi:hypothetical protein
VQEVPPLRLRLGRLPRLTVPRAYAQKEEKTMNDRTKYPRGSSRDILVRLRRMEREIQQMLTDVQSVNDNNPNFADCPIDVGRYIVQLKKMRGVIAAVEAVVATGELHLPSGILDPILEKW